MVKELRSVRAHRLTAQGEPTLIISTTGTYNWVANDEGSGAGMDVTIYRPNPADDSFFIIGDYAQGNYQPASGTSVIVKAINDDPNSPLLKPAKAWNCVWTDKGSGGDYDWSLWSPLAPDGYVGIGMVGQLGYSPPDIPNYRCVRKDLVAQSSATTLIWNDKGSGAHDDVSIWVLANVSSAFAAQGNYNPYSGAAYSLKGTN